MRCSKLFRFLTSCSYPGERGSETQPKCAVHIPELDGARGLAILLVMVLHFTMEGGIQETNVEIDCLFMRAAQFGWIGVDLFFVLSGFLITGILLDAKGSKGYFRNFYIRRALRIFPLYYGFLAFWFFGLPRLYTWPADIVYPVRQLWSWIYLTNISQAIRHTLAAAPPYTGHFWSLAVEEQFYAVWPIIVFMFSRRTLLRLCGMCLVCAPIVRFWLWTIGDPIAAYVLAPARMDALAMGAALALVWRGPDGLSRVRVWAWPTAGTACALFVCMANLHTSGRFDGVPLATLGYSCLAVLFAALLTLSLQSRSQLLTALFGRPEMRFMGKYSYALYVFHLPIGYFVANTLFRVGQIPRIMGSQLPGQTLFFAASGVLSIAAALSSWHLYEKHFLALKERFAYAEAPQALLRRPEIAGRVRSSMRQSVANTRGETRS